MKFDLSISGAPFQVAATRHVQLAETLGDHPRLAAEVVLDGKPRDILAAVGATVVWAPDPFADPLAAALGAAAGAAPPAFKGVLTGVAHRGGDDAYHLSAVADTRARDLVRRTVSYAPDQAAPVAIPKLPGMDAVFKDVAGAEKITRAVHHLLQYDQTDWQFLVLAAGLGGLFVRNQAGKLSLVDGGGAPTLTLAPGDVVEGSDAVAVQLCATAAEALRWDPALGKAPDKPTPSADLAPDGPLLRALLAASLKYAGPRRRQVFCSPYGPPETDQAAADRAARGDAADLLRWHGVVRTPAPSAGDVIALADDFPAAGKYLVLSRRLVYDPRGGSTQFRNDLDAAPAAFAAPALAGPAGWAPLVVAGRVASVNDPDRHGRVKVNFPWQPAAGEDPAKWPGVWCLAPQPFGGIDAKGRAHGVFNAPAPFDWVQVLIGPPGVEPPVILGAVYRGKKAAVPETAAALETDRLLFQSSAGVRVVARDAGTPSLTLAVVGEDGKELAVVRLSGDGTVAVEAKATKFAGAGGEKAAVTISGKLDVQ